MNVESWGINLSGGRWHLIDPTKYPEGQVSFCGVGVFDPSPQPPDGALVCKRCRAKARD